MTDQEKNPFWKMLENDSIQFVGDVLADSYEFVRRQLVQMLTTLMQGGLIVLLWDYLVQPAFMPTISVLQALGVVLVSKILLPIHRTDVVPPLTAEVLSHIVGETDNRSMERSAVAKGVTFRSHPVDRSKMN